MAVKYVDVSSLYDHFFGARQRLGGGSDDFSIWFGETLGKSDLAKRVRAISSRDKP